MRVSMAGMLARLMLIGLGSLALISTLVVSLQMQKVLEETQRQTVEREVRLLQLSLDGWLRDRLASLREQGRLLALASDWQLDKELTLSRLAGDVAAVSVVSQAGEVLYVSGEALPTSERDRPWLKQLFAGVLSEQVEIHSHDGRLWWQLAVAVGVDSGTPLALVAEIPLTKMLTQLHLAEQFGEISLRIERDGQTIATVGEAVSRPLIVEHNWPQTGLVLHYELDMSEAEAEAERTLMVTELIVIALFFSALAGVLSYRLGWRWLVEPVLSVSRASSALASGNDEPMRQLCASPSTREMQRLIDEFRYMAETVHSRECALNERNQQLEQLTDDLRSQQAQIIKSERMASIGTLSAGVAHEINNPLGYLKSNLCTFQKYSAALLNLLLFCQANRHDENLQTLLSDYLDKVTQSEDLEYVQEDLPLMLQESLVGAERIQAIVQGLKTFSDDSNSKVVLMNVNDSIESALTLLKSDMDVHAELSLDLAELPPVRGSASQLNQVMFHLMRNAVQATADQGQISVRSELIAGEVVISVQDDGEGIAESEMCRLFTPFYTTRPVGQGAGLGLAISHNFVTQHFGNIEVESELGQGALFRVRLPAVMNRQRSRDARGPVGTDKSRRAECAIKKDAPEAVS